MIVVMKDGEVIENGAYKELLEKDGAFATMCAIPSLDFPSSRS